MHIDQWTYRKSHDHVKLWFPNLPSLGLSLRFPSSRQAELRGLVRAGPWEDATDLYKQIVKQLGCDAWGASALDCLLAKEKDTLLNVSDSYYGNCSLPHKESIVTTQWAPAMDGVILPQMPVSSTPCPAEKWSATKELLCHRWSCWRRVRLRPWRCCWARTRTRGAPSLPTRPRPCRTSTSTHAAFH